MEQITGTIDGLVLVSGEPNLLGELELLGEVLGDVTVGEGVILIMNGIVHGDVLAHRGSTVTINGYVGGALVNHGASIKIAGSIGSLIDSMRSPAAITAEARIRDRK